MAFGSGARLRRSCAHDEDEVDSDSGARNTIAVMSLKLQKGADRAAPAWSIQFLFRA